MADFREHSKTHNWKSEGTIDHINAGSLQRIADAAEKMAGNYIQLQNDLNWYKRDYEQKRVRISKLERSNAALRGHIKRLKTKTT